MRASAVIATCFAAALSGCVQSSTVECGDSVCPSGLVCVDGRDGCFDADAVGACEGVAPGGDCSFDEIEGRCTGGVCTSTSCGDGVIDPELELCDDGNGVDGDSCSSDCRQANCLVPVTHATVAEVVADEACTVGFVSGGVYDENIVIARSMDLVGVGAESAVIDGGARDTVVIVRSGVSVTLRGLTIRNGSADCGGGIRNEGGLILEETSVLDSQATNSGGGICHLRGALFLFDSTVSGNLVDGDRSAKGGGIFATAAMSIIGASSISNNTVQSRLSAGGGGVFSDFVAPSFAIGCELRGNEVIVTSDVQDGFDASGGAISSRAGVSIEGCELTDNRVELSAFGGILYGGGFGGAVYGGGLVSVLRSRLSNNTITTTGAGSGGAVCVNRGDLTIADSAADGNQVAGVSSEGGAFFVNSPSGGIVGVFDSAIVDNRVEGAEALGGGAAGGGLSVTNGFGTVTVDRSSFVGNVATSPGRGGALHMRSATNGWAATIKNSTFGENEAGLGAVVSVRGFGGQRFSMHNVTATSNVSAGGSILEILPVTTTVQLENSILAGNSGSADCDITTAISGSGYNLLDTGNSCVFAGGAGPNTELSPADLLLQPVDRTDESPAYLPGLGSPAIDGGDPTGCQTLGLPLVVDQRNLPRPAGNACDVGAVERQ